jgi:Polyketide cyclase / dehydrase and lipid transport
MEQLPYIDEHRIHIDAEPTAVWDALVSVLRAQVGAVPGPLARAWALSPRHRRGDWTATPLAGNSIPGFEVVEVDPSRRLALRGRHRFSRYALVFELEPADADACSLRAQSWAEFPGVSGAAYRALVVGTRGHRLAVRRLLRNVARGA